VRLDKFISYTLDVSRVDAKKIIKSKDVKVNGEIITDSGFNVNIEKDEVTYLEEKLVYEEFIYLMLNKPKGYVSATIDFEKTVLDLVNEYKKYNLGIVGRLDKDSEGLILLTNDGKLNHQLTNPKKDIYKKYYVEVEGKFTDLDILKFKEGIMIIDVDGSNYLTKEAILEIITDNSAYISISEGKFHQIKKMCAALGKSVTYLKRIQIGPLMLDPNLKVGEYRKLSTSELDLLISLTQSR